MFLVLGILGVLALVGDLIYYNFYVKTTEEFQQRKKYSGNPYHFGLTIFGSITIVLFLCLFVTSSIVHSVDLGTLRKQDLVIRVYQEKNARLHVDLQLFYETGSKIPLALVNSDTPVKEIVSQLAKTEAEIAKSGEIKAQAEVNIAQRKAGPLWFVVSIYGEK
jgi:hypothetical protein